MEIAIRYMPLHYFPSIRISKETYFRGKRDLLPQYH